MKKHGQKEYIASFLKLHSKGLTDREIAKELNTTKHAIESLRYRRKLPVNREYRILTPESVKFLFDQGLSDKEIGEKLSIHRNNIKSFRLSRGWGDAGKPFNRNYPIELTDVEMQILVGGLLGDASLKKAGFSISGKFEQSFAQEEYCRWKHEKLSRISGSYMTCIRPNGFNKEKISHSTYFHLKTNPYLEELYFLFYGTGKKQVHKDLLKYLSPLAIAIWFMDDGKHSAKTKKGSSVELCTDSFSTESNQILIDFFKEKYGIICTLTKRNRLYFVAQTKNNFLELIKPYILPCLWYKYTGENKKNFLENYFNKQEILG